MFAAQWHLCRNSYDGVETVQAGTATSSGFTELSQVRPDIAARPYAPDTPAEAGFLLEGDKGERHRRSDSGGHAAESSRSKQPGGDSGCVWAHAHLLSD